MQDATFIIWDQRDGNVRTDEEGTIISDGLIGRVGSENAYIKIYAQYENAKFDINGFLVLDVGEYVNATFRLSGSTGHYRVYRVA